jgi:hypothetical protein
VGNITIEGAFVGIRTSVLNRQEIAARDLLVDLMIKMGKLPAQSRQKVYEQWDMLHVLTPKDAQAFEANVLRVNQSPEKARAASASWPDHT